MLYDSIDENSYIIVFSVVFNFARGQHKEQIKIRQESNHPSHQETQAPHVTLVRPDIGSGFKGSDTSKVLRSTAQKMHSKSPCPTCNLIG